jgi:uncharacterized protein (DUF1501 family)
MDDILLSRRKLLQGAGCLAAAMLTPGIRVAFAEAPIEERFIFVILRGAMDGLAAIPPSGDRNYKSARNGIALPASACTPLDDFFGAHKNLANFAAMFKAGEALALHAVSTPYRERSHFDAQDMLESGAAAPKALRDGWLNRALLAFGPRKNSLGLAVGQTAPLALQGEAPVGTWAPSAEGMPPDTMLLALEKLYQHDALFHAALAQAIEVHGIADPATGDMRLRGGARGLRNREAMKATVTAVGKILSDPKGPRIATIEMGGWDTHAQQGTEDGALANNFAALDAGFGAMKEALGPHWRRTVVLAATEFGRTVAQNGTAGTDHGTASCALLLGGAVRGGRVLADWPGLDKTHLYENRDLRPTADLRQLAKAVLTQHLRLPAAEVDRRIFPESGRLRPLEGVIKA